MGATGVEREEIQGEIACFEVQPTQYAPLRDFSCGDGNTAWERYVNSHVAQYATGWHEDDTVIRVAVERPGELLIGVVGFVPDGWEPEHPSLSELKNAGFLEAIGVSKAYRGKAKNGRTLGDHVLSDALGAIRARRGPSWIAGHLHEGNVFGERLLKSQGFFDMTGALWGRMPMP